VDARQHPWFGIAGKPYDEQTFDARAYEFDLGPRNTTCASCGALLWPGENQGTAEVPQGGLLCCDYNRRTPVLEVWRGEDSLPDLLHDLVYNHHQQSQHFYENARSYNLAFRMASNGIHDVQLDPGGARAGARPGAPALMKVQGSLAHRINPGMVPGEDRLRRYMMTYALDGFEQLRARLAHMRSVLTRTPHGCGRSSRSSRRRATPS
jgi:hypothetical protein